MAARIDNERAGEGERPVDGCGTTGDDWQFLRLDGSGLLIDPTGRTINRVGLVLATLLATVGVGPEAGPGSGGMVMGQSGFRLGSLIVVVVIVLGGLVVLVRGARARRRGEATADDDL